MFEASAMLFVYVETPLHAGTARGLGAVDLPIQRERTTDYPIIQASSIKGRLRAEARGKTKDVPADEEREQGWLRTEEFLSIFGPETGNASDYAGALSTGDARILLFPVRSLAGVFAWTTSRDALARFQRELALTGDPVARDWRLPSEPGPETALVGQASVLKAGESVVLEEFSFTPQQDDSIAIIAGWLADNALPQTDEYAYWREALPQKLCILPEDAFRDFARYATEIQTHVKIDPDTKTVGNGALWTSESLPVDTLMYAPLLASRSRNGTNLSAQGVLDNVTGLDLRRTQLGGDETTGQGMVALRFTSGRNGGAA